MVIRFKETFGILLKLTVQSTVKTADETTMSENTTRISVYKLQLNYSLTTITVVRLQSGYFIYSQSIVKLRRLFCSLTINIPLTNLTMKE